MKIYQIPHVIFESTSQFSFKFCINLQCHQISLFCTFFSSNITYFVQKETIKVQIFDTFECSGQKYGKLLMSILKQQVNSSSNFVSFFIVMTDNSSVIFKLMHFVLWIKGSHQSPNFETFKHFGNNLPNSSSHFLNHKSVFLQILHHSSVS